MPIYVDGAVTSGTNQFLWDAGTEIEFIYDGTNYRVVSAPISDGDITNLLNSQQVKIMGRFLTLGGLGKI